MVDAALSKLRMGSQWASGVWALTHFAHNFSHSPLEAAAFRFLIVLWASEAVSDVTGLFTRIG